MENFQIEDAKTRFFTDKEHYLNFRQAWKEFHNSDKLVWREDVEVYSYNLDRNVIMRNVKHTSLTAEHYMLYNLLRGYDIRRGFTKHGEYEWATCYDAAVTLVRISKELKDVNSSSKFTREFARKRIERLLLPFNGTVTHEMLRDLGEQLSINAFFNQNYPQFGIEEWKDFEKKDKAKSKLSIADRLKEWRAA